MYKSSTAKRNRQTHIVTLRYIATCRLTHSHMREFVAMCNLKAKHHIIKRAKIQYNLVKRPSRATACCVSFVNLKTHIFRLTFCEGFIQCAWNAHTFGPPISLSRLCIQCKMRASVCVCVCMSRVCQWFLHTKCHTIWMKTGEQLSNEHTHWKRRVPTHQVSQPPFRDSSNESLQLSLPCAIHEMHILHN